MPITGNIGAIGVSFDYVKSNMLDLWAIGTGIFSIVLLTILGHAIVIKDCMKNDLKQETLKERLKYVLFMWIIFTFIAGCLLLIQVELDLHSETNN